MWLKKSLLTIVPGLMMTISAASFAKDADQIEVMHAKVRHLPKVSTTTAAFMTIKNKSSKEIVLIEAMSDKAKVVELHTHKKSKGMMEMIKVENIKIPANGKTELKPGSYHIMLINLNTPTKMDEVVEITLKFSDNSIKKVTAKTTDVRKPMKHKM